MRRWRIRVRQGTPALAGLALGQVATFFLPGRYWTRTGAWRVADRWRTDYELRRTAVTSTVLVDVVHRREVPS